MGIEDSNKPSARDMLSKWFNEAEPGTKFTCTELAKLTGYKRRAIAGIVDTYFCHRFTNTGSRVKNRTVREVLPDDGCPDPISAESVDKVEGNPDSYYKSSSLISPIGNLGHGKVPPCPSLAKIENDRT